MYDKIFYKNYVDENFYKLENFIEEEKITKIKMEKDVSFLELRSNYVDYHILSTFFNPLTKQFDICIKKVHKNFGQVIPYCFPFSIPKYDKKPFYAHYSLFITEYIYSKLINLNLKTIHQNQEEKYGY